MICRPTRREAEEYHHYANVECADWSAIEKMLALKNITPHNTAPDEFNGQAHAAGVERDRRLSLRRLAR